MINVRDSCKNWANKTFREELESLNVKNKKLLSTTTICFSTLGILDKCINGYACESLPKTEEGHTGIKITYSELFHKSIVAPNFSPVTYLLKIVEAFLNQSTNIDKLNGSIARGLRTLTSLLREPDFAYNIEQYLKIYDLNTVSELNSNQDRGDHTDVLLDFKNDQYRIWLFQFSPRGLPHDIERVTGKRGELPSGMHILCPLHTELALNYDSNRIKANKLAERIEADIEALTNCSVKAIKRHNELEKRITKNTILLNSTILARNKDFEVCSNELDIVDGWFFYSDKHIKRIADLIISHTTIEDYDYVYQILIAPERYLSEVRIFKK